MTLSDVSLPITDAWGKAHALAFAPALAARLAELHAQHGTNKLQPMPVALTDGRLMLCADILTEVMPGGLLCPMWEAANHAVLLPSVEVIPWEQALELLPPPPPFVG